MSIRDNSSRDDQDADISDFPRAPVSPIFRLHDFPWDMRRLSGIFGRKVNLTRIFLQIPAQIGVSP